MSLKVVCRRTYVIERLVSSTDNRPLLRGVLFAAHGDDSTKQQQHTIIVAVCCWPPATPSTVSKTADSKQPLGHVCDEVPRAWAVTGSTKSRCESTNISAPFACKQTHKKMRMIIKSFGKWAIGALGIRDAAPFVQHALASVSASASNWRRKKETKSAHTTKSQIFRLFSWASKRTDSRSREKNSRVEREKKARPPMERRLLLPCVCRHRSNGLLTCAS